MDSLPRRAENQKDHFSLCFFLTVGGKICVIPQLACEQALREVLAAAREKGRRASSHVSGIWIPPRIALWLPDGESPSTELSDFCQPARSGDEREC